MPFDFSPGYTVPQADFDADPAAGVLREAAAIVRRGWCQGDVQLGPDRFCAMGAIWASGGDNRLVDRAFDALREYVAPGREVDWGMDPIALWNDHSGRTAEEVATAMETVADRLLHGAGR